jgi:three-Cys-motif partner protein
VCALEEQPSDGGLVAEVGEWAEEKLTLLTKYIEISGGARQSYLRTGATYIDLYSGPGLLRIRESGRIVAGSPLAAHGAATRTGFPFTHYLLGDEVQERCDAAALRLRSRGADARAFGGDAEHTVGEVLRIAHPQGLHFALLDPYNLDLPFGVIESLAGLKRIDMMIHLSTGSLQRNLLNNYLSPESRTLDRFAPGWRNEVDLSASPQQIREQLVRYWFSLLQRHEFGAAARMHPVRNSNRSTMYWLVFVSRHPLAQKFWNIATTYLSQQSLL